MSVWGRQCMSKIHNCSGLYVCGQFLQYICPYQSLCLSVLRISHQLLGRQKLPSGNDLCLYEILKSHLKKPHLEVLCACSYVCMYVCSARMCRSQVLSPFRCIILCYILIYSCDNMLLYSYTHTLIRVFSHTLQHTFTLIHSYT